MIVYWLILLIPALALLHPSRVDFNLQKILFWAFGFVLILAIGFRYEVGGDWDRYLFVYSYLDTGTFIQNFKWNDAGYELFYWISMHVFNGIYFANFASAIVFVFGLIRFCQIMPMPWLALFVSIPFLVVVVAMGYTRQAAALGMFMFALVSLIKEKRINFYILIFLGAVLFHKSLLITIFIDFFYNRKKLGILSIIALVLFVSVFVIWILPLFKHLIYYYVTTQFHHSEGAVIRVVMSTFAGIIFFIFRKRFKRTFHDENLWLIFSLVSIALLPLAFSYSTFIDRIAIFFIPLQLVIFSRVPMLIYSTYYRTIFIVATITLYVCVLFVWLNFAKHAYLWVPYKNILLE